MRRLVFLFLLTLGGCETTVWSPDEADPRQWISLGLGSSPFCFDQCFAWDAYLFEDGSVAFLYEDASYSGYSRPIWRNVPLENFAKAREVLDEKSFYRLHSYITVGEESCGPGGLYDQGDRRISTNLDHNIKFVLLEDGCPNAVERPEFDRIFSELQILIIVDSKLKRIVAHQ